MITSSSTSTLPPESDFICGQPAPPNDSKDRLITVGISHIVKKVPFPQKDFHDGWTHPCRRQMFMSKVKHLMSMVAHWVDASLMSKSNAGHQSLTQGGKIEFKCNSLDSECTVVKILGQLQKVPKNCVTFGSSAIFLAIFTKYLTEKCGKKG